MTDGAGVPDLPLGEPVDWSPVEVPSGEPLRGAHVLLRPIDPAGDAAPLFAAVKDDPMTWAYLPDGPYESDEALGRTLAWERDAEGWVYYAIEPLAVGHALGQASYLRIEPSMGTIEIGHIWFAPELRRTAAATEAIYLLARHAFDDLGYRRLEWKCHALNAASRSAAERFGFRFEGVFRKHQVVKGRNRDTAWLAIVDEDWPVVRAAFEAWLADENFDADGTQKRALHDLMPTR
jgi:RimJ/RimL family protein N-acetyltransferase